MKVIHRNIKHARVELKTGELTLILPKGQSPEEMIDRHKFWINEKKAFVRKSMRSAASKRLSRRSEEDFRDLAEKALKRWSHTLGTRNLKLSYRQMKSKWASCSSKKRITLNTLMVYLPARLIQYVIYHELCHTIKRTHNSRFWALVSTKYKNHGRLEQELFQYWFLAAQLGRRPK